MLRLVGGSGHARATRAATGVPAAPPAGASLMANIRFARALGWTSRRLERQPGAAAPYLVGAAPGSTARAARRTPLR